MSLIDLGAARASTDGRRARRTRRPAVLLVDLSHGDGRDLSGYLDRQGLAVHDAPLADEASGTDGPETDGFDAVVLIARLPDPTALAAIRRMTGPDAPPLLMVARAGEALERVLALEMGADDLVGDEADTRELLARLHGLMRRRRVEHGQDEGGRHPDDAWRFSSAYRALVTPEGRRLNLSSGDEAVLAAFTDSPEGLILDRQYPRGDIRTAISRLRRKVRLNTGLELPIQNILGRGYRFDAPLIRT